MTNSDDPSIHMLCMCAPKHAKWAGSRYDHCFAVHTCMGTHPECLLSNFIRQKLLTKLILYLLPSFIQYSAMALQGVILYLLGMLPSNDIPLYYLALLKLPAPLLHLFFVPVLFPAALLIGKLAFIWYPQSVWHRLMASTRCDVVCIIATSAKLYLLPAACCLSYRK
jgi:hypothetical protein